MPLLQRHHPERNYYGEDIASDALRFLNGFPGIAHGWDLDAGQGRILSLVSMLRPLVLGKPANLSPGDLKLLKGVNRILQRYHSSPRLLPSRFPVAALVHKLFPKASPDEKPILTLGTVVQAAKAPDAFEHNAALAVLKLAELNSLDSLRTCKQCASWFFARFSHQQFCCKKCRIKNNSSSDEWKAYKRQKAREYYQLHKSGKVRER